MSIKSILITLLTLCLCLPALAQDKPLPKDIPTLKVLAEKGDAKAQLMLASKYYFGRGVPKDLRAAAGWYHKAAAQGNAEGQYSMGLMYWRGEGVKKDLAGAYYWLSIAAAAGHTKATDLKPKLAAGLTPAQKANADTAIRNWLAKQPATKISRQAVEAYEAGRYREAIQYFEAILTAEKKKAKPDETRVGTIHGWLGQSYKAAGLLNQSLAHHQKELAIWLKQSPNQAVLAATYGNIAGVHVDKGEYDKALELLHKSLYIKKNDSSWIIPT